MARSSWLKPIVQALPELIKVPTLNLEETEEGLPHPPPPTVKVVNVPPSTLVKTIRDVHLAIPTIL